MKITTIVLALLLAATAAYAQFNGCPPGFCPVQGSGAAIPPPTGALLLEDGTSILLLEDNASQFCLEGGC